MRQELRRFRRGRSVFAHRALHVGRAALSRDPRRHDGARDRELRPPDQGRLLRPRPSLAHGPAGLRRGRIPRGRGGGLDPGLRPRRHERAGGRLQGRHLQDGLRQGRLQHGQGRGIPARSVHVGFRLHQREPLRDRVPGQHERRELLRLHRLPGGERRQLRRRRVGLRGRAARRPLVVRRRQRRRLRGEALPSRRQLDLGEPRRARLRAVRRDVQPRRRRLRRGARLLRERRRRRARLQRGGGRDGLRRRPVRPGRLDGERAPARRRARRAGRGGRLGRNAGRDGRGLVAGFVRAAVDARRERFAAPAHPLRGRLRREPQRNRVRARRPDGRTSRGRGARIRVFRHPARARRRRREPPRGDRLQRRRRRHGVLPLARGGLGDRRGPPRLLPGAHARRAERRRRPHRLHARRRGERAARLEDRPVRPGALLPGEPRRRDLLHARRLLARRRRGEHVPLRRADQRVVHLGRARRRARRGLDTTSSRRRRAWFRRTSRPRTP